MTIKQKRTPSNIFSRSHNAIKSRNFHVFQFMHKSTNEYRRGNRNQISMTVARLSQYFSSIFFNNEY